MKGIRIIAILIIIFGLLIILNSKLNLHIRFLEFSNTVQWICVGAIVLLFLVLLSSPANKSKP